MWWLYAPVGPGQHGPDEEMAWRDVGSPTEPRDEGPWPYQENGRTVWKKARPIRKRGSEA